MEFKLKGIEWQRVNMLPWLIVEKKFIDYRLSNGNTDFLDG